MREDRSQTEQREPLLSVIIPVFNGEAYLKQCLESVCRQPCADRVEILVIDDGSTDGSNAIAGSLLNDQAVRYQIIKQENNGVGAARNKGIIAARGKYICFLDQDDVWVTGFFDTTVRNLLEEEFDMISFAFYQGNQNLTRVKQISQFDRVIDDPWKVRGLHYRHHSSYFFKRQFILENALFVDQYRQEDERFRTCCLSKAGNMKCVSIPVFIYRNNAASVTHRSINDLDSIYRSCLDGWRALADKTPDEKLEKEARGIMLHLLLEWFISGCAKKDFAQWYTEAFENYNGKSLYQDHGWMSENDQENWKLLFESPKAFCKKHKPELILKKIRRKILRISAVRKLAERYQYPIRRTV